MGRRPQRCSVQDLSVMCNNTKSYICISELWSVCEWCRLYCTYNICSACPDSLICFQFTFLPVDFYRSTLINHRVIYIKAAPCSGSRNHAMVTEVKLKTAGKWPRTDIYSSKPAEAAFKKIITYNAFEIYLSFMFVYVIPGNQTHNLGIIDLPVYHSNALVPLTLTICYLINKDKKHWKNIELTWKKKTHKNIGEHVYTLNSNGFLSALDVYV